MLKAGATEIDWKLIHFHMLPKSGDLSSAANWRPIAILPIFYKIFSRMIFGRLKHTLEARQSPEQTGFRTGIRLEDALVTVEMLVGKAAEWNLPLFIASLDLKKAFDKVDHRALFNALRSQGVSEPYIALLLELYSDQTGSANNSRGFQISRGVKQGDVLSSLLFNAALESVFARWKERLTTQGWSVDGCSERLTNTRYADDILLYAKNLQELHQMLELLHDELAAVGLQMHEAKTKILTSSENCGRASLPVRGMSSKFWSGHRRIVIWEKC
jgi:retron-type reverse transcriptase